MVDQKINRVRSNDTDLQQPRPFNRSLTNGPLDLLEIQGGSQQTHLGGRKRATSHDNEENKASDDDMVVVSNAGSNAESKMG